MNNSAKVPSITHSDILRAVSLLEHIREGVFPGSPANGPLTQTINILREELKVIEKDIKEFGEGVLHGNV